MAETARTAKSVAERMPSLAGTGYPWNDNVAWWLNESRPLAERARGVRRLCTQRHAPQAQPSLRLDLSVSSWPAHVNAAKVRAFFAEGLRRGPRDASPQADFAVTPSGWPCA